MEVEAVDEGRLSEILVGEGTDGVAVNTPIAVLAGDGQPDAAAAPALPKVAAEGEGAREIADRAAEARAPEAVAATAPERDWGPTRTATVREALRDAMAAEMHADDSVFPDGRGSGAISGRLQDQPGSAR